MMTLSKIRKYGVGTCLGLPVRSYGPGSDAFICIHTLLFHERLSSLSEQDERNFGLKTKMNFTDGKRKKVTQTQEIVTSIHSVMALLSASMRELTSSLECLAVVTRAGVS